MSFHVNIFILEILKILDTVVETLGLLMFLYVCKFKNSSAKEGNNMLQKFIVKVNNLITKSDVKCLARAADILTKSDKHDSVFFEMCGSLSKQSTTNVVYLGENYAIVRTSKPSIKCCSEVIDHDE